MTELQKLEMLQFMSGETDRSILLVFLALAGQKILRRAFPYRPDVREVPAQYGAVQVEIACYLLNKRGAEGQTSHSENGIIRSYENAGVPESMLKDVTPFASALPLKRR